MDKLIPKILSALSWLFGIIFLITGVVALLKEGVLAGLLMIAGAALLLPPIKIFLIDKQPKLSKGIISIAGVVLILFSTFNFSSSDEKKGSHEKESHQVAESVNKEIVDYSPIAQAARIPVGDDSALYRMWGDEWTEKLNQSMLPALETVAKHEDCDKPTGIRVSGSESVLKEKGVYTITCANDKEFYLDLNDVNDKSKIISLEAVEALESKRRTRRMGACMRQVESSLHNPKSFDPEYQTVTHGFNKDTGKNVVLFRFYAKNKFNAEIINDAVCAFDVDSDDIVTDMAIQ